jgi:two-component system, sensor histidine kinase
MRALRDRPVRWKLMGLTVITSALALGVVLSSFVAYEHLTFRRRLAHELAVQAEIVGRNSAAALTFNDAAQAERILSALAAQRSVLAAAIYTARGPRFAQARFTKRAGDALLPERWLETRDGSTIAGGRMTVQSPIVFDGERLGTVVLRADLAEVRALVLELAAMALLVFAGALGLVWLVSARLQHTISDPIQSLTETARAVREHQDFALRAQGASGDEIGFLIRAFNEMLERIQQREAELEQARDSAVETAQLKSAFLANMSHEIRTPLNIVIGYAELLEGYFTNGDDEVQEIFDTMRRGSRRLIDTIDKILDIAKIETGAFELQPHPVRVAGVIERCVAEARVLAEQKQLALSARIDEPDVVVKFDPYCLSQSLMNLVANAIKFTEQGGVFVRLQRADDGALALSVSDTGIGIDPGYLPRLFEAFSQEDPSMTRRFEGSGLGLALVRNYARMNGAEVSVTSSKGRGSTFTMRFPREIEVQAGEQIAVAAPAVVESPAGAERPTAAELPAARAIEPAPPSTAPASPASPRRGVLVVEDDVDTLAYMRRLLGPQYEVFVASSAAEARQLLQFNGDAIRLALMDLSLKRDEDGLSLTRSMRADERWRDLPIVATTAHAFPEDRTRALAAGCTDYLTKPVNRSTLLTVVARHLGASDHGANGVAAH